MGRSGVSSPGGLEVLGRVAARARPVGAWAAIGVYAVLALAVTAPLVRDLAGSALGWPGDNFEYIWKLWWVDEALLHRGVSPFFNPDVYYPTGFNLSYGELTPANTFLLLPLTHFLGPVVTYNLAVLASFVLSGLGTFLLVVRLSGSRWGALVGGAAFAFSAYRFAHLPGHLNLLTTGWLPFAFLFLERARVSRRGRDAGLAGLFYSLTALGSWYLAYAAGLGMLVYLAARTWPWKTAAIKTAWRPVAVFCAVTVVLVVPFAIPYLQLAARGGLGQSLSTVDHWSVSVASLIVPSPRNPLWGALVPRSFDQEFVERFLYLGITPTLLALLAIWRRRDAVTRALAITGGVFLVLALGTTLRVGGSPLLVTVPDAVATTYYSAVSAVTQHATLHGQAYVPLQPQTINVPMPALLLYLFAPGFGAMRCLGRFALIGTFAIGVLAGLGVSRLGWSGAMRALGVVLLIGLTVFDTYIPYETSPVHPRAVDRWLGEQADNSPLVELPLSQAVSGPSLYYAIYHHKPVVFGYGTHLEPSFRAVMPALSRFPEPEALAVLRNWNVRWVVITPEKYGADWPALAESLDRLPFLRLRVDREGTRVYELDGGV